MREEGNRGNTSVVLGYELNAEDWPIRIPAPKTIGAQYMVLNSSSATGNRILSARGARTTWQHGA